MLVVGQQEIDLRPARGKVRGLPCFWLVCWSAARPTQSLMMIRPHTRFLLPLAGLPAMLLPACGGEDTTPSAPVSTSSVYVNELMPWNQAVYQDPDMLGEYDDWLELYNASDTDVDLGGHFISDSDDNRLRHELPAGTIVPTGGVLVLIADGEPVQGDLHLPFRLSRDGEGVWLTDPDGNLMDSTVFGATPVQYSFARFPDGTGEFAWCEVPTPGELNGEACGSGGAAGSTGAPTEGAGGATGMAGAGGA